MPLIVLASSSSSRRELLGRLGLPFQHHSPDIDETPRAGETPRMLAERLSREKAQALAEHYPHHLIIGSDQVVSIDDDLLGKPGNLNRARQQLQRFSGRRIHFLTGVALLDTRRHHCDTFVDLTSVDVRSLGPEEIEGYLIKEPAIDNAGSFYMEKLGTALFEGIHTSDPSALIGLPLIALCRLLRDAGINPLLE
ncbi:MAF protein [Kushneria marisflavi]|uniref:Nucleoside triphosphate pyrophosphatase n=2 Tax=Kushneria marisflavi TaxID=157779 RepID=A0A240UJY8_9GAMM|nr:Maf family nucleotide pyrophosphatase [Kushneria marisflavi]ART61817.1 septum formation protein Maf [Kushneria marisflavi]RKD86850.1 MAF protein [Kushneria marisflavi]